MKVSETDLPGVLIFEPDVFGDARGFFFEAYNQVRYEEHGLPPFVQDNLSRSEKGVLRGMHFQHPNPQGKLVSVLEGEVYDVAVDVRVGSPSFGRWVGAYLSAENKRQLYVPEGFAHGFLVTGETALFFYKCTAYYSPETERSLLWNDPEIGIDWPSAGPTLSSKDRAGIPLAQMPAGALPPYQDAGARTGG